MKSEVECNCAVVLNGQYRLFEAVVPLLAARADLSVAPGSTGHGQSALDMIPERDDSGRFVAVKLVRPSDWLRRVIRDYMLTHSRIQAVFFGHVRAT